MMKTSSPRPSLHADGKSGEGSIPVISVTAVIFKVSSERIDEVKKAARRDYALSVPTDR